MTIPNSIQLKIVLSRKGFDSGSGGVPSPIMPDGRLVPLPIPATHDPHSYNEIIINGTSLGQMVEELTAGKIGGTYPCHLDPDLDVGSLPRLPNWRPAFGQIDTAQSHLARHNVRQGDIFLFFGWFRAIEKIDGRWRYVPGAPNLHIIYGWMNVGEVIPLFDLRSHAERLLPYADHPHLHGRARASNTLYLATERLCFPHIDRPGGGIFRTASVARTLTDISQRKRSVWKLPAWFHPKHGTVLSYHENPDRWELADDGCILSSAARGQEFVLATPTHDTAELWLRSIFNDP